MINNEIDALMKKSGDTRSKHLISDGRAILGYYVGLYCKLGDEEEAVIEAKKEAAKEKESLLSISIT